MGIKEAINGLIVAAAKAGGSIYPIAVNQLVVRHFIAEKHWVTTERLKEDGLNIFAQKLETNCHLQYVYFIILCCNYSQRISLTLQLCL